LKSVIFAVFFTLLYPFRCFSHLFRTYLQIHNLSSFLIGINKKPLRLISFANPILLSSQSVFAFYYSFFLFSFFLNQDIKLCLIKWILFLPQASQTPGNELSSGHCLCLQQPDIRGWSLGPTHPSGVQAAGDSQSQQASVCTVESQQSVSTNPHT